MNIKTLNTTIKKMLNAELLKEASFQNFEDEPYKPNFSRDKIVLVSRWLSAVYPDISFDIRDIGKLDEKYLVDCIL